METDLSTIFRDIPRAVGVSDAHAAWAGVLDVVEHTGCPIPTAIRDADVGMESRRLATGFSVVLAAEPAPQALTYFYVAVVTVVIDLKAAVRRLTRRAWMPPEASRTCLMRILIRHCSVPSTTPRLTQEPTTMFSTMGLCWALGLC